MTIEFVITEQDYLDFNIDHFNNAESLKSYRILFRIIPPIILFMTFFAAGDLIQKIISVVVACIFTIIWIIICPKVIEKSISKSTSVYIKNGKANDFIGRQTVKLTDSHIEESNASTLSQIQYSSVERIHSGHGLFYIYIGAIKAIIIPSTAFADDEQKNAFFNILSQKTGLNFE